MKKLSVLFLTLLLLALNSCKKDTVDVTDLLKTVPSSAAGVVVVHLEELIEDAGCKVKDRQIILGEELQNFLDKKSAGNEEEFRMLLNGDSGIELNAALVFYDSGRVFLTFSLYDVNKFMEFVEKNQGTSFGEEGSGVKVCGNVALKGAQGWVCLSSHKRIDPDAIASYATLKDSQSFLVSPMASYLLENESDIHGWTMLDAYLDQLLDRGQRTMFTLGSGVLFKDAESVKFEIDFKKGEIEAELMVLNDDYKPAQYQLPAEKIDVSTLKELGETCDAMMAFTVNPKLMKQLTKIGGSFGGAIFGNLLESFDNVDGTIGLIGGSDNKSVSGVLTAKGDISKTLKDLISEYFGPVSIDGKLVKFGKGNVAGKLSVADCADELKGSCLGIVVDATTFSSLGVQSDAPQGFKLFVAKVKPESGGLELEIEAKTANEKENALITLIKSN